MSRVRCFVARLLLLGLLLPTPAIAGIPIDFILFALTLVCVALFHHHTLPIAVGGLVVISIFKIAASPFNEGAGVTAWVAHLGTEWVMLSNLLG